MLLGEFGVADGGDSRVSNGDTTDWSPADEAWLKLLASFSRGALRAPSWFFWSWNANSRDTKGLVGPQTTWREVQWRKVRLLARDFGLRPWYCAAAAAAGQARAARKYGCI